MSFSIQNAACAAVGEIITGGVALACGPLSLPALVAAGVGGQAAVFGFNALANRCLQSVALNRDLRAWCDEKLGTPEYHNRCIAAKIIKQLNNCGPCNACCPRTDQVDLFQEDVFLENLFLVGLGLTTFPPGIVNLTNLEDLNLRGNKLRKLPPEIVNLRNLRNLDLSDNDLRELPPEICDLNLRWLDLSGNPNLRIPSSVHFRARNIDRRGTLRA